MVGTYFRQLYRNSFLPVLVTGPMQKLIYSNVAFDEMVRKLFLRSLTETLPVEFWRNQERCLDNLEGITMQIRVLETVLFIQTVPFLYEGEYYAVSTFHTDRAYSPTEEPALRILRKAHGKMNQYLDTVYGYAEIQGIKSKGYKELSLPVRRILRLVNHLYRMLDGEDVEFYSVPVDLGAFANTCLASVRGILPGVDIRLGTIDPKVFVQMMPEDTELVFATMISNGLRFCKNTVWLSVTRKDGKARLTVEDDGPGMVDPARLDEWGFNVSDKFGQGGLGFSLIMGRKLMERQDATIEYERDKGITRFHIVMDEIPDPKLGKLAEWKPEPSYNMLSQMRVELSDYHYYNHTTEVKK